MQRTYIFMVHTLCKRLYLFILFLLTPNILVSQNKEVLLSSENHDPSFRGKESMRIVFYNVENLFDIYNDSLTLDDEFLPFQGRFWNKSKFETKIQRISQAIIAIGGWEPPALVGLCEIENRYVLNSIVHFSILRSAEYNIIHKDSPDKRGIDVALIYRKEKFDLLEYNFYEIKFPFDSASKTRDILYARGVLSNQDTLSYLVNHWPSKFGGEIETAPKRLYASEVLGQLIDSLAAAHHNDQFVIAGDFNDNPSSYSIQSLLKNRPLINLMDQSEFKYGTNSFENKWYMIDQLIVSEQLVSNYNSTFLKHKRAFIFNEDFLLTEGVAGNKRPFRTYQGPAYLGGFSDHLPIYLDLILR